MAWPSRPPSQAGVLSKCPNGLSRLSSAHHTLCRQGFQVSPNTRVRVLPLELCSNLQGVNGRVIMSAQWQFDTQLTVDFWWSYS